jgi:hypothetical protein
MKKLLLLLLASCGAIAPIDTPVATAGHITGEVENTLELKFESTFGMSEVTDSGSSRYISIDVEVWGPDGEIGSMLTQRPVAANDYDPLIIDVGRLEWTNSKGASRLADVTIKIATKDEIKWGTLNDRDNVTITVYVNEK